MSAPSGGHGSTTSSGSAGAASPSRREMPVAAKLLAFGVGLAAVFGATLAVGSEVGPVGETAAAEQMTDHSDGQVTGHESSSGGVHDNGGTGAGLDVGSVGDVPGGLQVSEGGYTFVLASPVLPAGTGTVEFVIEGPDGSAVTEYEIEHEKELHLIAVRRDFTGFQHVHPERASDGTWAATLDLTGGTWRLFADFTPVAEDGAGGEGLTLGADVTVTGPTSRVAAASPEVRRVDIVDGYRVELAGDLTPGEESNLALAVTRQGDPVVDLQPYLGARGHLVALREGDLAYLHVHPTDDEDATGHEVGFAATVPSVGGYRLYLDFRVDGVVRTASFVLRTDSLSAGEPSAADDEDDEGDTHGQDDHGH